MGRGSTHNYDYAKRLYVDGADLNEIARITGISFRQLTRHSRKHGWSKDRLWPGKSGPIDIKVEAKLPFVKPDPKRRSELPTQGEIEPPRPKPARPMTQALPKYYVDRLLGHGVLGIIMQVEGHRMLRWASKDAREARAYIDRPEHDVDEVVEDYQATLTEPMSLSGTYTSGLQHLERSSRLVRSAIANIDAAAALIERGISIERDALALNTVQTMDAALRRVLAGGYRVGQGSAPRVEGYLEAELASDERPHKVLRARKAEAVEVDSEE